MRALPPGRGGCSLNTIRFVEFGPTSCLASLCMSLATSHGHSASATHVPGHWAPQGVGGRLGGACTLLAKKKKKMKCENNDRFK